MDRIECLELKEAFERVIDDFGCIRPGHAEQAMLAKFLTLLEEYRRDSAQWKGGGNVPFEHLHHVQIAMRIAAAVTMAEQF